MYACSWVGGKRGGVKRTRDQEEEGASEKEGNKSNDVVARRVEACRAGGVWLVRPVATKRKSDRVAGVGRLLTTLGMQERRKTRHDTHTLFLSSYTRGADVMMRSKGERRRKKWSGEEHPRVACTFCACFFHPLYPLLDLANTSYTLPRQCTRCYEALPVDLMVCVHNAVASIGALLAGKTTALRK